MNGEERRPLTMYAIYNNPRAHPGKYVVRAWVIGRGPEPALARLHVADTLEEARTILPPGLTRMPRDLKDDPVIVETWL